MDSVDLIGMLKHKFLCKHANKETIIPVHSHVESMSLIEVHFGPWTGQNLDLAEAVCFWLQVRAWVRDSDLRGELKVKQTEVGVLIVKKVATH